MIIDTENKTMKLPQTEKQVIDQIDTLLQRIKDIVHNREYTDDAFEIFSKTKEEYNDSFLLEDYTDDALEALKDLKYYLVSNNNINALKQQ